MADSERSELDPPGIRYDIFADGAPRVGWYRFEAPPGTRAIRLPLKARRAAVWVDGKEVPLTGATATLPASRAEVSQVALRVEHEPGYYAGAAFENPVAFTCEDGVIALGDWGDHALDWRATRARWCTANGCRCRRLRSAAGRCSTWAGCAPPPRCGSTAPRRESGWPPLHRRRLRPAAHWGKLHRGDRAQHPGQPIRHRLPDQLRVRRPHRVGLFGPVTRRFQRQVTLRLEPERRPDR